MTNRSRAGLRAGSVAGMEPEAATELMLEAVLWVVEEKGGRFFRSEVRRYFEEVKELPPRVAARLAEEVEGTQGVLPVKGQEGLYQLPGNPGRYVRYRLWRIALGKLEPGARADLGQIVKRALKAGRAKYLAPFGAMLNAKNPSTHHNPRRSVGRRGLRLVDADELVAVLLHEKEQEGGLRPALDAVLKRLRAQTSALQ